jgi:hypothetical protein
MEIHDIYFIHWDKEKNTSPVYNIQVCDAIPHIAKQTMGDRYPNWSTISSGKHRWSSAISKGPMRPITKDKLAPYQPILSESQQNGDPNWYRFCIGTYAVIENIKIIKIMLTVLWPTTPIEKIWNFCPMRHAG